MIEVLSEIVLFLVTVIVLSWFSLYAWFTTAATLYEPTVKSRSHRFILWAVVVAAWVGVLVFFIGGKQQW